jgi:uncharacterized OsmC-like protein
MLNPWRNANRYCPTYSRGREIKIGGAELLLGALSACAQITCQMVAAAMGIETQHIEVIVEGD